MLALREIVIHGLTVPAGVGVPPGEVDGTAGYKLVLPVASGELADAGSYADFQQFLSASDFAADAAAHHAGIGNTDIFS